MQSTLLYVKPGFGRWHVVEEGYDKSLAFFDAENQAIDYAIAFGKTKPAAVVRVLDERGDIKSEISVEMSPP